MRKLFTIVLVLLVVGCARGRVDISSPLLQPSVKVEQKQDNEILLLVVHLDYRVAELAYTIAKLHDYPEKDLKELEAVALEKKKLYQELLLKYSESLKDDSDG